MKQFPFTDYDFWAYISVGFVFLLALDHILRMGLLSQSQWTLAQGVVAVSCAYAVGHLFAGISSAVFERRVLGMWLGKPTSILFGVPVGPHWFRRLCPSYYQALPENMRRIALEKGAARSIQEPGEGLFWLAFDSARGDKIVMDRLSAFLNLYGFCRNLALVSLVDASMFLGSGLLGDDPKASYGWALAGLILSVGMFSRYMKFYRHYSLELFTSFAYAKAKE